MTTTSVARIFLLLAAAVYSTDSLATVVNALSFRPSTSTRLYARQPQSGDWTDDTKSSRYNSDVIDYLPPWRNHDGMKDFNKDVAEHFSGSQANPKKAAPFSSFSDATPQENVSPMLKPGKNVPRGGGGGGNNTPNASGGSGGASTLLKNIKWPLRNDPPGPSPDFPLAVTRIGITILSTISTWYLHIFNGYSPVLASSATTLLVSMCLDRRLGQAAFCGSFAGMSGGHLVPNISVALLLGSLTSASYEMLIHIKNAFLGIGGRLGATAFLATAAVAKYQNVRFVGKKLRRGLYKSGHGLSSIVVTMVLYHALGSFLTIFLRESSDDAGAADPVRSSSVVGLLGALFLKDPTAVLALYGGSFVGMSLPSRLMHGNAPGKPKPGKLQNALPLFGSFAAAGAIAGLIHAVTIHSGYWNGGWGGKAGLCAFAGCWVYRGIGNAIEIAKQKGAAN
ncbi:hypothetical protein ACHAWT_007606 [Skeletonema menzelii]